MLIAFEGIDGSGKSTQARLLAESLAKSGVIVELTREPTKEGSAGVLLRKELVEVSHEPDPRYMQLLFVADRAWHVANFILPKINHGAVVITDRYIDSTRVYGAASGLEIGWLTQLNSKFPKADITFILDITPEEAEKRLASRNSKKEIFESKKMLIKLRSAYSRISRGKTGYHVINANRSQDEIHTEIASIVREALKQK
jgi:dTMP kinase